VSATDIARFADEAPREVPLAMAGAGQGWERLPDIRTASLPRPEETFLLMAVPARE